MKTKRLFILFLFVMGFGQLLQAQQKTVKGKVTQGGEALPGVSIVVKNTTKGVSTDFDGNYEIKVNSDDILVFSAIGMKTKEVKVGEQSIINVEMEESSESLKKVIITALGIKRQRKSLTYAAQDIKAEELQRVKQTNPMNSLAGKISGLTIVRNSSGTGGSVKLLLRGSNNIGNNQPLFVIDGIPIVNNSSYSPTGTFGDKSGGNRDGGDALSLLNPDDIESISVLKGASASALYGSAGLNGVVLITTKKGKKGGFLVNYSSTYTMENAAYFMDFSSDAKNNIDKFFKTGNTLINSVSISGGNDIAQTYFSFSNTGANGIIPTNKFKQNTISLRETATFLDDKMKLSGGVNYSLQSIDNRPISALYYNPLVGLYNYDASQGSITDWEKFEEFDPNRNLMQQRWFRATTDIEQNPYWILYRNPTKDDNAKMMLNIKGSYKISDFLTLKARGSYDKSGMKYNRKIYATTNGTLSHINGRYITSDYQYTRWYGDLMAVLNYKINDNFNLNAIVGTSMTHDLNDTFYADSGSTGGLQYANVFSIQNFKASANVDINEHHTQKKVSSVFSSATIGYQDKLYLDLTARNDWTSSLPAANRSYFYPSIGLTGILTKMFDFGNNISFGKFRMSYAEVGSDVPANFIYPNRDINFGAGVQPNDPIWPLEGTIPRPQREKSYEIGTEWKFFNNRYGIDIGYYYTNTYDQYFIVDASAAGSQGGKVGVNSGNILNKGWEISAFAIPIKQKDFKWRSVLNYAKNNNKIIELSNPKDNIEIDYYTISPAGPNSFAAYIVEGGSFGDIYGQVVKRDSEGRPIVDLNGGTTIQEDINPDNSIAGLQKVGNANPDFTLGWNNSFDYKQFSLDFLIDGRFGGVTMGMTEAIVEGMSDNSQREQSGTITVVDLNGNVQELDNKLYYSAAGGRNGFTGEYVYDATNIRLAEMSLSYKFKLDKIFIKNVKVSVIGNNLFFLYKKAPFDPTITSTTGNALQGVNVFNLPSTRSFGFSVNLKF